MKLLLASLVLYLATHLASAQSYQELYRPQFHFTPAKNWMNDPNGMVFYDGEYHLFYQHNPFGNKWGHMSWGHAVSKDLVHWEHLPLALPEANDIMIFSGSAVVDWKNTSGFGVDGKPPLVAIYTGHHTTQKRQDQRIAYSNDRGRTWTKWSGNPVLDIRAADFRDPKVFWHPETSEWIMVLALSPERKVLFYGSPDLKHWRPLGEFGPAGSVEGIWECPDLFPLPVEGGDHQKWVLIVNVGGGAPAGGSGCQYFVGEFDGKRFTPDHRTHPRLTVDAPVAPKGVVFADFENGYGTWKPRGEAFGASPAVGPLEGQMAVEGFLGKHFVNSFLGGDRATGTLTSPSFTIEQPYLSFLIGGGAHKKKTCLNLIIDDRVVRSSTGNESERLSWSSWDLRELKGKTATLQIVDEEEGGWGHLNVDHIVFSSDSPTVQTPTALWADHGRDFYAAVSWSDVPVDDGRRIWLGWMSNWQYAQDVPTKPWRSALTVPRTLSLRATANGYRLLQQPIRELASLGRKPAATHSGGLLAQINTWLKDQAAPLLDIEIELAANTTELNIKVYSAGEFESAIRVKHNSISLDRTRSGATDFHPAFAAEHEAPLQRKKQTPLTLRILIDTSSIEVFANGGESVISDLIFPKPGPSHLSLSAPGTAMLNHIRITPLNSAWQLPSPGQN